MYSFNSVDQGFRVQLPVSAYQIFISRPHTVRRRRVDCKLCLHTDVWVAAGKALVAAITGETNRLISLDLSSLGDGSQLRGRTAVINYGQGSTLAHTDTTHTVKTSICRLRLSNICRTAPWIASAKCQSSLVSGLYQSDNLPAYLTINCLFNL
jgi:hypothetical protein